MRDVGDFLGVKVRRRGENAVVAVSGFSCFVGLFVSSTVRLNCACRFLVLVVSVAFLFFFVLCSLLPSPLSAPSLLFFGAVPLLLLTLPHSL